MGVFPMGFLVGSALIGVLVDEGPVGKVPPYGILLIWTLISRHPQPGASGKGPVKKNGETGSKFILHVLNLYF
jgi:hypothetical protein